MRARILRGSKRLAMRSSRAPDGSTRRDGRRLRRRGEDDIGAAPCRTFGATLDPSPCNVGKELMPEFSTTRRVRHSAAHMFDLVADVEHYPEFVPLCRSLKVRQRIPEPEGVEVLIADMTVAYKFIHETFTSRVTLDRPNLHILVEYLQGPFSRLENRWIFHPTGEKTCRVEFFISYEFKSRTLGLLMGAMFDAAFRRFAAAFERRAAIVYAR